MTPAVCGQFRDQAGHPVIRSVRGVDEHSGREAAEPAYIPQHGGDRVGSLVVNRAAPGVRAGRRCRPGDFVDEPGDRPRIAERREDGENRQVDAVTAQLAQ